MKKFLQISLLLLTVLYVSCSVFAQTNVISFEFSTKHSSCGLIPADSGIPNLKSISRYIAIPKGSSYDISLTAKTETTTDNIYIDPASSIKDDINNSDSQAIENSLIYSRNEFFPEHIVTTELLPFHDFDMLLVNIAVESYNPIQRQLKTIDNGLVTCILSGAYDNSLCIPDSHFNQMLLSMTVNPDYFNLIEIETISDEIRRNGCDYLIITPDNDSIKNYADTLRNFRETQGILTKVLTLSEVSDNNPDSLKAFLNNVYNEWCPVPSAVLLLGDYSNDPMSGITSYALTDHPDGHQYEPYLSDNRLVDFDNNGLPDIVIARMPVANQEEARLMINKTLQYESDPYTDDNYYAHPITAMGYQRNRWFQLCSEIIAGYFEAKGRQPIHLNAIHQGTPDSIWSTGQKTENLLNYFGPNGLAYIPSTMSHLTDWDAGADDITNTLEDGSFLLVHRDHGSFQAWGEPNFNNWYIDNLDNDKLSFIMSANCQTGDFSYGNANKDCLAERFLRTEKGAVGVIAASQLSYSYVNDTYVWGFIDYLFPDFMPDYGTQDIDFQYPAFASTYGKYFLAQSSFPYNTSFKVITYNLFHYFGDAYLQLNSDVPQHLSVEHPESIRPGEMTVTLKADAEAIVALSVDNNLVARRKATGNDMNMHFSLPFEEGTTIKVVVTKQNHYRYESYINVCSNIGINEVSSDDIKIYPNPATGMLHIESHDIIGIRIFNSLGQTIEDIGAIENTNIIHFDCSNTPNGLYFIQVISRTQGGQQRLYCVPVELLH